MINAAISFWQGAGMYSKTTYFGNPISLGPSWILLVSPLVLTGFYWMLTPLIVGIFVLKLRKITGSWHMSNITSLLLASSLVWWELTVIGSDLPAFSLALPIVALLTYSARTITQVVLVAILIGLLATARTALFYIPCLYALMIWPLNRRLAITYALVGTVVCLGLHTWFYYLSGQNYPPLHLLGKGSNLLHTNIAILTLLVCGVIGLSLVNIVRLTQNLSISASLGMCWIGFLLL